MDNFIKWAKQNNWQVDISDKERDMPEWAFCRYSSLPGEYVVFLKHIRMLSNQEDTCWFLSIDNFKGAAFDTAWQANSFEKISLEAADGDSEWTETISQFWDEHIPIVFSLKNGYEYYAICLSDGSIVNGIEPEFEDISVVASSLADFLRKIKSGDIVL